jgi:FtsP/CotA-like multicopper oxidase with cupredoxin domain
VRCFAHLLTELVFASAAQTNYFIEFGGLSATVIAADGQFVKPWSGETVNAGVWVGVSQRLDVILDIPVNVQNPVLISAREESPDYSLRSGIVLHTGLRSPSATDAMLATNTTGAGWWSSMSQELQLSAFTPLPNLNQIPDRTFIVNLKGHHGTINGYSYFEYPTAPFHRNPMPFRVQYGQRIHMIITNLTPEPHAMHLHGHHFQIIAVDGQTINGGGAIRDTVMVPAGCHNTTIAFDALNPGIHEFHCHMACTYRYGTVRVLR